MFVRARLPAGSRHVFFLSLQLHRHLSPKNPVKNTKIPYSTHIKMSYEKIWPIEHGVYIYNVPYTTTLQYNTFTHHNLFFSPLLPTSHLNSED